MVHCAVFGLEFSCDPMLLRMGCYALYAMLAAGIGYVFLSHP